MIVAVDGHAIANFDDVLEQLDRHQPGEKLTLRVKRMNSERDVQLTLGDPGAE